jgi:hypothetical protein
MDPRLAYARELEQRDAAVAARIEHVLALGVRADELRRGAETVEAELGLLPERRMQLTAAAAEAERALAHARRTLADAQREQTAATEERAAEERHARLVGRLAALEHDEKRLRDEADELGRIAAQIADELEREPRIASTAPAGGELAALKEWTARTHAAVLVARSGLESERDKIVREANELASSVVGEALQATSAASLRGRLERSLP